MNYLLDSNVCIRLLRTVKSVQPAQEAVRRRLHAVEAQGSRVVVCSVVRLELLAGAHRSERPEANLARVAAFLTAFSSLPFDDSAAMHGSQVRATLQAAGTLVSPFDLLIAAIALANNLTVVTHNTTEFARIPGLATEDWEVP